MMKVFLNYWPVLVVLLNAFTAWVAWSLRQLAHREVNGIVAQAIKPLAEVDTRLVAEVDEHGDRLVKLEQAVQHLPQREDVERLTAAINGVDRSVSAVSATLAAVKESGSATQAAVDRLYRYFLEKGA